ncbi:MAG: Ni/Fe hydrogenase subunit alpha [Candidatus Hodarchaeales archaeon]|jgi:F420-non-reducing hydrogenase large subunit
MMNTEVYKINPVTRIEGNARISLLMEGGEVKDAHFHVMEFKGFEKYLEGRMVYETPRLTTRACGICPVSHHLAAAKATDRVFETEIPETAELLRELMHVGQYIHSHALHFFFLAAPDLVIGPDTPVAERNLLGILKADKELAKNAIKMRAVGQDIIRTIGGKAVHPVSAIPGGFSHQLDTEKQDQLLKKVKEILPLTLNALETGKEVMEGLEDIVLLDSSNQTSYMGTVKVDGSLNLYSGFLKIMGPDGGVLEQFKPDSFERYIAERTETYTYLKFPYYKIAGWPDGIYRVGPLARINVADHVPTEHAGQAAKDFKEKFGKPAHKTFLYHAARLIELVYANERAVELLEHPAITSKKIRNAIVVKAGEGIGVVEAPRGTLIHYYKSDGNGRIKKANLIVATVHNNAGINNSVKQVAMDCIKRSITEEGMLNRMEMVVRAYDPCLTCAAHAINGRLPLIIDILDESGYVKTIS